MSTRSLLRFKNVAGGQDEIVMSGKAPAHADPNYVTYNPKPVVYDDPSGCRGMRYQLRVKSKTKTAA